MEKKLREENHNGLKEHTEIAAEINGIKKKKNDVLKLKRVLIFNSKVIHEVIYSKTKELESVSDGLVG